MIKTLQKKFVITAMTAITVFILLLLGTINIINIVSVRRQLNTRLSLISSNEGNPDNLRPVPGETAPPMPFGQRNEFDTFISSNFFVVRFNNNGEAVFVDISRLSSINKEKAISLATEVYKNENDSGETDHFRYMKKDSRAGKGKVIVFLDTSNDIYSYIRVLFLSVGIGAACWMLMLLFTILLSKKAIRPIAMDIEKQKQFVTNAGHEIKTPLAIIQSNTEAMELYAGENKWSRNIKAQTQRLNTLMKNLLTLARMDESTVSLIMSDFSLSRLITEGTSGYVETLGLRGISLQTDIQASVMFHADREHISQLISVLMDNAVKYANDGGSISVLLEKNDKKIKIRFTNTCDRLPSVPPEKLFDRFFRDDEARTQKSGGYGIGLSVAQSITEAYKGSLSAEYKAENTIVFTVLF